MLLFYCREKYERREGMAPPYLQLQKLLKGLRLRVATICPPRFKNYFFATKMFHWTNDIIPYTHMWCTNYHISQFPWHAMEY